MPRRCLLSADETVCTLALHGGEEYELLFTARSDRRIPKTIAGVSVTRIGEIVRWQEMKLVTADGNTEALKPARLGTLQLEGRPEPVPTSGKYPRHTAE